MYRAFRTASACSAGISCASPQLPKYAEPTIHGSVARIGAPSCRISVAFPTVSKPTSNAMTPPRLREMAIGPRGGKREAGSSSYRLLREDDHLAVQVACFHRLVGGRDLPQGKPARD